MVSDLRVLVDGGLPCDRLRLRGVVSMTAEEHRFNLEEHLNQFFSRRDVPTFCWWPRVLLTGEIAHWRWVLGRQRRCDGKWEYYNDARLC